MTKKPDRPRSKGAARPAGRSGIRPSAFENKVKSKKLHSGAPVGKPAAATRPAVTSPKSIEARIPVAKPPIAKEVPAKAASLKAPGQPIAAQKAPAQASKPASVRPSNGAIKVGVVGCAGRMGQMLLRLLIHAPGVVVVGGTERRGSVALGRDLGALAGVDPLGISVSDDPAPLFAVADVVVDFTNPGATIQHAALASKTGCALVIGTTGFDPDQLAALQRAAQRAPIVLAANMSLGVNLLQQVVEEVARILDPDWDIEIVEMHHKHKVDAPSGTALALGEAAARGRGQLLRRIQRRARDGHVGPRIKGEVGFAVLRGGDVVGDHTVIFAAEGERVEISHRASSREIFGRGAVKAVLWAFGRRPGLYGMRDVLGFTVSGPNGGA